MEPLPDVIEVSKGQVVNLTIGYIKGSPNRRRFFQIQSPPGEQACYDLFMLGQVIDTCIFMLGQVIDTCIFMLGQVIDTCIFMLGQVIDTCIFMLGQVIDG